MLPSKGQKPLDACATNVRFDRAQLAELQSRARAISGAKPLEHKHHLWERRYQLNIELSANKIGSRSGHTVQCQPQRACVLARCERAGRWWRGPTRNRHRWARLVASRPRTSVSAPPLTIAMLHNAHWPASAAVSSTSSASAPLQTPQSTVFPPAHTKVPRKPHRRGPHPHTPTPPERRRRTRQSRRRSPRRERRARPQGWPRTTSRPRRARSAVGSLCARAVQAAGWRRRGPSRTRHRLARRGAARPRTLALVASAWPIVVQISGVNHT